MPIVRLALVGLLALTVPIVAHAVPLAGKSGPAVNSPAPGIVKVWGGCGRGWHPVPGHWSQWRGGWVPTIPGRGSTTAALCVNVARRQRLPRLINTERADTVGAQLGVSDWSAFFSHPVGAEAAVGGYKIIVLVALADVLRRRLAPFRVRVRVGRDWRKAR